MKTIKNIESAVSQLFRILLVVCLFLLIATAVPCRAALQFFTGGYVSYPVGTTNIAQNPPIQIGTLTLNPKTLYLMNNGLLGTNQCIINLAITTDNTNFSVIGSPITFPSTNGSTQLQVTTVQTNIPVYGTLQLVNTNSTALSAALQQ